MFLFLHIVWGHPWRRGHGARLRRGAQHGWLLGPESDWGGLLRQSPFGSAGEQ